MHDLNHWSCANLEYGKSEGQIVARAVKCSLNKVKDDAFLCRKMEIGKLQFFLLKDLDGVTAETQLGPGIEKQLLLLLN